MNFRWKIRHRPLNIQNNYISLYRIVFEGYQKSTSDLFLHSTPCTMYFSLRLSKFILELELKLIQSHMAQKPVLRGEVTDRLRSSPNFVSLKVYAL